MIRAKTPPAFTEYNEATGAKSLPGTLVDEAGEPVITALVTWRLLKGDYPAQVYCFTCKTPYVVIEHRVMCNGHNITLCPFCRVDSAPWTNGRGV